jgi:hypothetical protein
MKFRPWMNRHRRALGLLAIVLPPLFPLLLHRDLYADWFMHQWRTRYYSAYLLEHFGFPFTVDSLDAIGQADPFFYGRFYYPLAGVLTAVIGYPLAIRVLLAGSMLLIAGTTLRFAARRVREPVAWIIAACAVWETYALTNLYFRYALTEFCALAALHGALLLLMGFLDGGERPFRERAMLLAGGFFCWNAAIGFHPITGLYGTAVLIVCLGSYGLLFHARELARTVAWFAPPAVVSVALHLPFLLTYRMLGAELGMQQTLQKLAYFSGIDDPLVRLSPVPLDIRVFTQPLDEIVGPFLNAQFNWSLAIALGLTVASAWRRSGQRVRLVAIEAGVLAAAGFLFAISISPWLAEAFSPAFNFPQFGYRFVGYLNFILLFGVLLTLRLCDPPESIGTAKIGLEFGWRVALGLAAVVLAMQSGVIFMASVLHPAKPSHATQMRDLTRQPDTQGGAWTYATPGRFAAAPAQEGSEVRTVEFVPSPGSHPHYRAEVYCREPCIVHTNVSAFAWNRLTCGSNGPDPFVYTAPHGPRKYPRLLLGCSLLPGDQTVAYELEIPDLLRWSIPATIWLFFAWGGVWLVLALPPWRRP